MIKIEVIVDDLNQISVRHEAMPLTTALGLLEIGKQILIDRSKNPKIVVPAMKPELHLVTGNGK